MLSTKTHMAEQIIDYAKGRQVPWLRRKIIAVSNLISRQQREWAWRYHLRFRHQVQLDQSRIPEGAIPILINNFNRLSDLRQMVDWIQSLEGEKAIIIVDNDSTYPPLLDYYQSLNGDNEQVVYLKFNSWRKGVRYIGEELFQKYPKYIITDSDLLPYPQTPKDLLPYLSHLMDKYPSYNHIGLSLEIEDLPDHNPLKAQVYQHESQFWSPHSRLLNEEVYESYIDTTFAMYRNSSKVLPIGNALRTARPYTLKHLDWYLDPQSYTEEYQYYLKSCREFATWAVALRS
ncbi:MAG: hypothetical protein AAFP19_27045 [Bacteroidota bacterium]